jgi:membrane protease YdiL (CAAX protease family)
MAYIIGHGGVRAFGLPYLLLLMWIPGTVSLSCRWYFKLGSNEIGLEVGAFRFFGAAIILPLALAFAANYLGALLGVCHPGRIPDELLVKMGQPNLLSLVVKKSIPLLAIGFIGAIGEELGWRGFLLPLFCRAKVPRPLLLSGVIWGLWHIPLVVWGGYYSVAMPAANFSSNMISINCLGFVIGWIRIQSGSIWTAVVMHAAHNYAFQFLAPLYFFQREPKYEIVVGDAGFIVGILYLLVALLGWLYYSRGTLSREQRFEATL